ncbi:MAG TPA: amidohydrolase family protein [Planctomycetota bacterium]|nr:amidohydrolase family protein [Planctomycetota bacterium]
MRELSRRTVILSVLAVVMFLGCAPPRPGTPAEAPEAVAPAPEAGRARHAVVDNHVHYLDFVQRTDGFEALARAMDSAGVEKTVVFGIPMVKMWTEADPIPPTYYMHTDSRTYYYSGTDFILAHDLARQRPETQDRFFPFLCGINPLDLNAADQIEMLLRMYPGFWKGIGELMSRHDDLTALTYGEPPRADHPALMRVYQLAARHKLPVLIHHNISSAWKREPIYLKELENALKENPRTTFIWAHAGISRRVDVPTLLPDLRRVLSAHPNLSIDISWVVYPDYIAKDKESMGRWVAFIEEFPDRVMIGSDKVAHWDKYGEEITKYYDLLDRLKPATAARVAKGNILRILAQK